MTAQRSGNNGTKTPKKSTRWTGATTGPPDSIPCWTKSRTRDCRNDRFAPQGQKGIRGSHEDIRDFLAILREKHIRLRWVRCSRDSRCTLFFGKHLPCEMVFAGSGLASRLEAQFSFKEFLVRRNSSYRQAERRQGWTRIVDIQHRRPNAQPPIRMRFDGPRGLLC